MKTVNDINDLNKIIRTLLMSQSELDPQFIRNAVSMYGQNLDKNYDDDILSNLTTDDLLMLFELQSRQTDFEISETEEDDSISYYKAYTIHITIYGNASITFSNQLIARLRSNTVRELFAVQGVYLESVSESKYICEFKNHVLWQRADFDINIACKMSLSQLNVEHEFDKLNAVTIYT